MLEVEIQKTLGTTKLECSFQAEPKGVTALFGASGAGKTSVINMIAGLVTADKGRIAYNGKVFFDSEKKINLSARKRSVGYVFQEARLFPNMSVVKNLLYGSGRKSEKPFICKPEELCELLGITSLLERMPANLSGGEKQRVAIGRALLSNPEILLMDEPLAALDGERRSELLEYIGMIAEKFDIPIIYVSHSVDEILRLSDNMAVLSNGKLVEFGKTVDVLNGYGNGGDSWTVYEGEVTAYDPLQNHAEITFGGGRVDIFSNKIRYGSKVRFRINAVDVVLCATPPPLTSARNNFYGKITDIKRAGDHLCDVVIDIGVPLIARVSEKSVNELDIKIGGYIFALVKNALIAGTLNVFRVGAAPNADIYKKIIIE